MLAGKIIWLCWLAVLCCDPAPAANEPPSAGGPTPETIQSFENYVRIAETGFDAAIQGKEGFLWANTPERRARLQRVGIICEPRRKKNSEPIKGGLIHDWIGSVFIPGATVNQVLALLEDYNNHKHIYMPDVVDSRILERKGDVFKVRFRLYKRKIVKAVLDMDSEIRYERIGGSDWKSRSYATRVSEIADAGSAKERELPPGRDHGYLWRLNSYWLFRERDGGVYVECEAISLSRGIPSALPPPIRSVIRSLPKDALKNALSLTREAVVSGRGGASPGGPRRRR